MSRDGWIALRPAAETIARAQREMKADRNQQRGPGLFDKQGWHGNLGEYAMEAWLKKLGLGARRIGGVNKDPDIEVEIVPGTVTATLGVKTRGVDEAYLDDLDLLVPVSHIDRPWDWWFHCAWVESTGQLWLVGAVRPDDMREGDLVGGEGDKKYVHPSHRLKGSSRALIGPAAFVSKLRSGAPARVGFSAPLSPADRELLDRIGDEVFTGPRGR